MEPKIQNLGIFKVYKFERNSVTVIYQLYPDFPTDIQLEFFTNTSKIKGAGKQFFCETLLWIQTNLPAIQTISLASVPFGNLYGKELSKENRQSKLNTYYKKLGFRPSGNENKHEFLATVEDLMANCAASGGRRKTRKHKRTRSRKHRL